MSNQNIVIDSATKNDIEDVIKLYVSTISKIEKEIDSNLVDNCDSMNGLRDIFLEIIDEEDSYLLVAKHNGKIVGFIEFFFAKPKEAYVIPVIKIGSLRVIIIIKTMVLVHCYTIKCMKY